MTKFRTPVLWTALAVLTAFLVGPGCGPVQRGQVEGKVLLDGHDVPAGIVQFVGADGQIASAAIHGGTYRIADVALGEATIVVASHTNAPAGLLHPAGPGAQAPSDVAIPERYGRPESSGLKYRVEAGPRTHNIELQTRP
jgi:hypothetical protein